MSISAYLQRITRTEALNIGFAGVTVLIGTVGAIAAYGMQHQAQEVERHNAEMIMQLERAREVHASVRLLKEQVLEAERINGQLRAKLPDAPEETHFLQQLNELATASGVSVNDFVPGGLIDRTDCKEIEMQVRVAGHYSSLCHWLSALSELPRAVRVSQLTIVAPPVAGGDCKVDVQLQLLFALRTEHQVVTASRP